MFLKIFCLTLILSVFRSNSRVPIQRDMSENAGKAAFFEIQCMRVGGICARKFACPPGTMISELGLCPEQQRHGMECCKPVSVGWKIRPAGGRLTRRQVNGTESPEDAEMLYSETF